jgi:replicative DNA helicase
MSILSLALSEQINIRLLLENPEFILRHDKNYFVSQIARDIFESIKECYQTELELTNDNLIIFGNKLNPQINKDILQKLSVVECNVLEFEIHFKLLKEQYAKNQIENKLLKEMVIEAGKKDKIDIEKWEELKNSITENIELIQGKQSLLINAETLLEKYEVELKNRKEGIHTYPTGDSYLDQYLRLGFSPGYITSITADSGIGKSIFALNLINKEINKGIPCLYISLENGSIMTAGRLCSMRLDINSSEFYFKNEESELTDKTVFELVKMEKDRLKRAKNFYFVEESSLSLDDIDSLGKEAKKKMGVDYLNIFIDLLSMVSDFAIDITPQKIEQNMNKLDRIAKKGNYHFINILQANGESVDFKPKSVQDCQKFRFKDFRSIKNAGAWGERSRAVLGLFRPKMIAENIFGKDHPEVELMNDIAHIQIMKQNEGPLATLKYLFIPEKFQLYRFKESN